MKSEQIGARLKQWRKFIGLTQDEFANQIRIQKGVYKKYEQGKNTPGGEALASIATSGVDINWLLTGEGEMKRAIPGQAEGKIPSQLKPQESQIESILGILAAMNEDKRDATINEFFTRLQELKRIDEMERFIEEVKGKFFKTGS